MNFKLIFMFGLLCFLVGNVSALEDGYCVSAAVSDISPSSIGVDEEFTVGIQIENCGDKIPEYVSFELLNPPVDIEIKEPLIINISEFYYGNSERFIVYHMKTTEDAQPGTHVIKTRLSWREEEFTVSKDYDIIFDVTGDKAELGIASLKTNPVLPKEGETVELTLRIENTGDGTAKSVSVYVAHPFQGLKQSFIGALESEEDGPAVLTFIVDKSGEFEFPVTISYYDDFGDNEIKTDLSIGVLEKPSNIGGVIFAIILIALIGGGIFYFFKVKKSKDKIIKQLMKGNSNFAGKKK
ncbi:hypothetical protein KY312_00915 [Candidatus Woesearchaeota archaeon]|nr:hypothetical protein [Candidatus Woesearchaeota archaeon]